MAPRGQLNFNTKSPTVKRILKEATELSQNPTSDYHAEPLEENLFEWHFTLRGPPSPSPYASGLYHGRVILPPTYPLRPPSFRFLTPTGRFEVNREICLSISGHHEETWQPAWGIRTALVAIRAFMDSDAKGQVGGLECNEAARRKMASESTGWVCAGCGKANETIMRERAEAVAEAAASRGTMLGAAAMSSPDVVVPDELRLAYREDLGNTAGSAGVTASTNSSTTSQQQEQKRGPNSRSQSSQTGSSLPQPGPSSISAGRENKSSSSSSSSTKYINKATATNTTSTPIPTPTRTANSNENTRTSTSPPAWIDRAILGVFLALVFMLLRKVVQV